MVILQVHGERTVIVPFERYGSAKQIDRARPHAVAVLLLHADVEAGGARGAPPRPAARRYAPAPQELRGGRPPVRAGPAPRGEHARARPPPRRGPPPRAGGPP